MSDCSEPRAGTTKADDRNANFWSSGTIQLEYGQDGQVSGIQLTPTKHHTIEHLGKKYAVFVPDNLPYAGPRSLDFKAVELKEVSVSIDAGTPWSPMLHDLALAATASVAVDILVKINGEKLCLRRAVVPARSHTK